jgi:hypothetical protein
MKRAAVSFLSVVASLTVVVAPAQAKKCKSDAVQVGDECIDVYEASVWEVPATNPQGKSNKGLVKKIQKGKATLAALTAGGATQRGATTDDYGAGCPDSASGCGSFYAVSLSGVTPSAFLTWFQAAAACRNSGKRLPTSGLWQAAALGTPDPGGAPGAMDCNTSGSTDLTGARANCVSDAGAIDMVGNLWEWTAEWGSRALGCPGWGGFSDDQNCVANATSTSTGATAIIRGGSWSDGAAAGVFAVNLQAGQPEIAFPIIGFRCVRNL